MKIEPIRPGTTCVWCWKEITPDQASFEVKEGAHAHLACDSRMLGYIESLGEWTE